MSFKSALEINGKTVDKNFIVLQKDPERNSTSQTSGGGSASGTMATQQSADASVTAAAEGTYSAVTTSSGTTLMAGATTACYLGEYPGWKVLSPWKYPLTANSCATGTFCQAAHLSTGTVVYVMCSSF